MSETRLRISKQLELSTTPGSIIMTDSSNESVYLAPGTNGQVIKIVAGTPTYVDSVATFIAQNGLTESAPDTIELGGLLIKDTDIDLNTKKISLLDGEFIQTFNGNSSNGVFTISNGDDFGLDVLAMTYQPTLSPSILVTNSVTEGNAGLSIQDFSTGEKSAISSSTDAGTGEYYNIMESQLTNTSKRYGFTSWGLKASADHYEFDPLIQLDTKGVFVTSDEVYAVHNYNIVDNQNYTYNNFTLEDTYIELSFENVRSGGTFSSGGKTYKLSSFGHELSGLDIIANQYPSTRDDSGTTTPVNFLYTDSNGKILSTTLSQILANEIKDTQTGITGTTLTLPSTPIATTLKVFKNGQLLDEGVTNDYTLSGNVLTFTISLVSSDKIKSFYFV